MRYFSGFPVTIAAELRQALETDIATLEQQLNAVAQKLLQASPEACELNGQLTTLRAVLAQITKKPEK